MDANCSVCPVCGDDEAVGSHRCFLIQGRVQGPDVQTLLWTVERRKQFKFVPNLN